MGGGEAADAAQTEAWDWETMSAASFELIEGIPKGAFTELKSFNKPPVHVLYVLGGVAIVLGEPNTEWATIKNMFKDAKFMNKVRAFDPTVMEARTLNKVK